jgi:Ca-activated chloride channel family protein
MKKNFRALSVLTAATVVTGALSGCGGARQESNSLDPLDAESAGASYEYSTETTADYACEESAPSEAMAPVKGAENSFLMGNAAAKQSADCEYYEPFYTEPYSYNTESYDKPDENGFFMSQGQPLSTFAADVDTASYANVRRMIEEGYAAGSIPMEAVRPEEFINYFSYNLKPARAGEKFGVTTEVAPCPWNRDHELMFVGVKAEDKLFGELPESNLVFLIDVSGSMSSYNKLDLLKKSFTDLVDNLSSDGTVSIVTYASREEVVLDGVDMKDKNTIKRAIRSLEAGGSTAGERGMEMAYEIAKDHFIDGGNNRIIMATDGDLNVGISDPDDLEKFIKDKKDDGIFLSVLGFGEGNYKDDRLERLADCGNGNYSYIDSAMEAKKVLVDEMTSTLVTVAKDVKFQIEFNPAVVNSYRLIGYENRQMDAVDFNNDAKDGGEIGSGHTVVALYELVTNGSKDAIDLKYQQNEKGSSSDDYATIKIRYKEPDEDTSRLLTFVADSECYKEVPGENLMFAGLVSEFAMLLGGSDYAGDISYRDIITSYKKLDQTDDYKDEFISLVRLVDKRS